MLALAGALWVGEAFAGAMITVMLASGRLLEARAAARADRELRLLVERTPRTARRRAGDRVDGMPREQVVPGDVLLVGTGEVVPVDGRLLARGTFDESALTGEPMPVERPTGDDVRSGVVNAGPPVELSPRRRRPSRPTRASSGSSSRPRRRRPRSSGTADRFAVSSCR